MLANSHWQSSRHLLPGLFLLAVLLAVALTNPPHARAAGNIEITDAWIPEGPPVAAVLAGYMTLNNHGKDTVRLIAVASPDFATIEIHQTVTEGNMSRMRQLDELVLYANDDVQLLPGGIHLMLIKPQRRLRSGDEVRLTLTFDDGTQIEVPVAIKQAAEDAAGQHHHHH